MIGAQRKSQLWRLGAIVVIIALPLVMMGAVMANVMNAIEASDLAARKAATTEALLRQLKRRPGAVTPVDAASLYLTSASESLARAELQDRATKLVVGTGGRLAEVQPAGTPEEEAAGTVSIQITLNTDNKGLLDLLYDMESGLPLLDVINLSAQRTKADADASDSREGDLRVDMILRASWRKGPG